MNQVKTRSIMIKTAYRKSLYGRRGQISRVGKVYPAYNNSFVVQLRDGKFEHELYHFDFRGYSAGFILRQTPKQIHQFRDSTFVITYNECLDILDLRSRKFIATIPLMRQAKLTTNIFVFQESGLLCVAHRVHRQQKTLKLTYYSLETLAESQKHKQSRTFKVSKSAFALQKMDEYSKIGIVDFTLFNGEKYYKIDYFDLKEQPNALMIKLTRQQTKKREQNLYITDQEISKNKFMLVKQVRQFDWFNIKHQYHCSCVIYDAKDNTQHEIKTDTKVAHFLELNWGFQIYGPIIMIWDNRFREVKSTEVVLFKDEARMCYISCRTYDYIHNSSISQNTYYVSRSIISSNSFSFEIAFQFSLKDMWMFMLQYLNEDFDDDLLMDAIVLLCQE